VHSAHNVQDVPNWLHLVTEDLKLKCMRDYITNSTWHQPCVCAVCGHDRCGVCMMTYKLDRSDDLPPPFKALLTILPSSIFRNTPNFQFGHPAIDNLMLCSRGLHCDRDRHVKVHVCADCVSSLVPKHALKRHVLKLPKYALANKLYLGDLPNRFKDLTWIEEQVCVLYRTMVYVYRLYHSDNPQDPYLAKGNSCVHPQNIVSTASVLPRTPADVAGCISIVFMGSNVKAISEKAMRNIFRVRKTVL
jgi:hypothetical protein